MISRSLIGDEIRPRYAVSILGYGSTVVDMIGGVKSIDELETFRPNLVPDGGTNTAAAFRAALATLDKFLPNIQDCPAPLVCHLTDGEAPSEQNAEIEDLAAQIKSRANLDGNVLLENIYIGEQLMNQPINPHAWEGLTEDSQLNGEHVKRLFRISSPLPTSYAETLRFEDYCMKAGASMVFPAEAPAMVELAFAVAGQTGAASPQSTAG